MKRAKSKRGGGELQV